MWRTPSLKQASINHCNCSQMIWLGQQLHRKQPKIPSTRNDSKDICNALYNTHIATHLTIETDVAVPMSRAPPVVKHIAVQNENTWHLRGKLHQMMKDTRELIIQNPSTFVFRVLWGGSILGKSQYR